MQKDYYLVLGVSRGSDINKIKKAYRSIAKRHHPDVSNEEESKARFLEIKEAYDTLSDHEKKHRYDDKLSRQRKPYTVNPVSEEMKDRISRFKKTESLYSTKIDEYFEGGIPGFYDINKGKLTEKDLFYYAVLSPDEAVTGGLYPVSVPVMAPCPVCSRSGLWEGLYCPLCDGYGRISAERKFALAIPPNVSDGTEITISLEGIGLKESFLHIEVHIAEH